MIHQGKVYQNPLMKDFPNQVQEFIDLQSNQTVMDEVLNGLRKDNSLYQRLRNRDVVQESYSSQSVLQRLLIDLKELAYF
jgi:hypothetical protein